MKRPVIAVLSFVVFAIALCTTFAQTGGRRIDAPRFWNDKDLADWAAPVVGLNVRPSHFSEKEYYAAPEFELVRTYPVYAPGREPAGYWDMLQKAKPERLIPSGAHTESEWIALGKRVFHELDVPPFRTQDPKVVELIRSAEAFQKGGQALQDGVRFGLRWAPTSKGLALSIQDCGGCHSRIMPDGAILDGAPLNPPPDQALAALFSPERLADLFATFFPGDTPGMAQWRQFGVPWLPGDINERLKTMAPEDQQKFGVVPVNVIARFNGSPFYPTKTPDLNGIRDRKYIDHTATHRLRGPADVMRYAALVSCCDIADFGPHRMLSDQGRRIVGRFPDDVLYALSQYLFNLEPPKNPNANDSREAAGKKVFEREGCANCHTPPLYTNNKLTLAAGYTPPADHPFKADIMRVSVGTDSNLALKTRKGTGFYKIPSLKGVWCRGAYGHDGSVTTLEEWFDPARLRDDYVPSGFKGYEVTHRAVSGHEFGLKISSEERAALIAFLKTL